MPRTSRKSEDLSTTDAMLNFRAQARPAARARQNATPSMSAITDESTAALATYRETETEMMARAIIGMTAQVVPAWIESGRTDWTALTGFLERAAVAAFTV